MEWSCFCYHRLLKCDFSRDFVCFISVQSLPNCGYRRPAILLNLRCSAYLFWHLIHLHATRICCFIMPHYEGRREGPCPFNKIAQFIIRRENSCYALNTNDIVFRMCKTLQSQIKAQWKPVPQLIHCVLLKLVGLVALYVATMRLRSIALLKPAVPIATMPWRSHLSVNC